MSSEADQGYRPARPTTSASCNVEHPNTIATIAMYKEVVSVLEDVVDSVTEAAVRNAMIANGSTEKTRGVDLGDLNVNGMDAEEFASLYGGGTLPMSVDERAREAEQRRPSAATNPNGLPEVYIRQTPGSGMLCASTSETKVVQGVFQGGRDCAEGQAGNPLEPLKAPPPPLLMPRNIPPTVPGLGPEMVPDMVPETVPDMVPRMPMTTTTSGTAVETRVHVACDSSLPREMDMGRASSLEKCSGLQASSLVHADQDGGSTALVEGGEVRPMGGFAASASFKQTVMREHMDQAGAAAVTHAVEKAATSDPPRTVKMVLSDSNGQALEEALEESGEGLRTSHQAIQTYTTCTAAAVTEAAECSP